MGIFANRYECLTRKQANIIYANIKNGNLHADDQFVRDMYDTVDSRDNSTFVMMETCKLIITLIFDERLDLAQGVIDGTWYQKESREIGRREPTEDELYWCFTEEDVNELREAGVPVYGEPEWGEVSVPYTPFEAQ